MNNVIGSRIKLLRSELSLTQRELAAKMNVGNSTLSQYENGDRTPNVDMQRKFAQLFGVSVDFLVGLTDDRTPKPERPTGNLPSSNPAYLEALQCLDSLSDDGLAYALRCLKAIKNLEDVKNDSGAAIPFEKDA